MTKRRRRPNFFLWTVLGLVLLFGYYFDQVFLPAQPNPFEATSTPTRSAESYVTEADELFKSGKLTQAIEAYELAIKSSPQDPGLYIALARIQVWAGLAAKAQSNAENAILLSPNNSMAHAVRAWAMDFQEGKNGDAMDEIDKALTLDPQNAIAHAYKVEILVNSNNFENIDAAIQESKDALALDPNALETRRARGYLLEATSNYEEAVQLYRSAIEVNPNIPTLHLELGRNLRQLQVYDDAIKEFTLANSLNPPDPEPDLLISRTYATEGDYTKALQYAESAVKDKPTDADLRGNFGVMYYRQYLYQQALEQLDLAVNGGRTDDGLPINGLPLTNDPHISEYYFTYGLALARTNQCGTALQVSQTLQTKFPLTQNTSPADQIVIDAANRIIEICQENLNNPAVDTPVPTQEATATPEASILLEGTGTP